MAGDQESVDVRTMDEYQWRAWLRSVTPFIDGKRVRSYFPKLFEESGCGDLMSQQPVGRFNQIWTYMITPSEGDEIELFSVHRYDHDDKKTSFYAVRTNIKKFPTGRSVEISYWPHISKILDRLGEDSALNYVEGAYDGHQNGHLYDRDLTIPACTLMQPNDDVLDQIQHEINAAWFHEPADLEREAIRKESEKANPDPNIAGRDGRL